MEWVLFIVTIIIVGCWLARSTQDYIDEQNERIRQSEYNQNDNKCMEIKMPNKHFCQGPRCHEQVTQDRFLKSRGVIRGRYASLDMRL